MCSVSNDKYYRKTRMETTELQLIKANSQFFFSYTDTVSSSCDMESSYHRITHKAALVHDGAFMFEFLFKTYSVVLYWTSERKYFS